MEFIPQREEMCLIMPVINVAATGRNIVEMRIKAGLSVRDLQAACGFTSPNAIYKWQNGECLPTIDNLVIIAGLMGTTVDSILVVDFLAAA